MMTEISMVQVALAYLVRFVCVIYLFCKVHDQEYFVRCTVCSSFCFCFCSSFHCACGWGTHHQTSVQEKSRTLVANEKRLSPYSNETNYVYNVHAFCWVQGKGGRTAEFKVDSHGNTTKSDTHVHCEIVIVCVV